MTVLFFFKSNVVQKIYIDFSTGTGYISWCISPRSIIFQLNNGFSSAVEIVESWENNQTVASQWPVKNIQMLKVTGPWIPSNCCKSLPNITTSSCIEYTSTSPPVGNWTATMVIVAADCVSRCKSNSPTTMLTLFGTLC